ncbi:catalase family peroxidase [Silvibacterium sp.]|uniref:catalase family peroxidase n=1 Tax=Silvibacterium sp. TaxID=1964179 RepID=UPI0039E5613A
MSQPGAERKSLPILPLLGIAALAAVIALGFAYTAGWLSPSRLTPQKLVGVLAPPGGPALGHRRNHAKGICFTGTFNANGAGSELSTAQVFTTGQYPVVGRFNLAGSDPHMPDAMAQVRGLGIRITTPNGQEWRSAMIDAPFFAAPTPTAFFQFVSAAGSKDPNAMKQYIAAHPEILNFIGWVKTHPRTESWTETRFNGLNSFLFVDASGTKHAVRWSLVPSAAPVALSADELAKRGPDFLQDDIKQRVASGPQHWELVVQLANPGDPTSDPTKAWPEDRRTVDVGTLTVNQIEEEADGPCRDINYDPSVLPAGITTSDDGFPAARSAAYRVSYDRRMAEEKQYPHTASGSASGGQQ